MIILFSEKKDMNVSQIVRWIKYFFKQYWELFYRAANCAITY